MQYLIQQLPQCNHIPASDALDESVGSGTKYWVVWEFRDRTPKSTHGELVVHVLSFDGKSRIPPMAVDGPKMNDVPGCLVEHYYSNGDGS